MDDDYDGDGDTNEEECGKSDEILDPFEIYQYTNPLEPTFMTFDLETFPLSSKIQMKPKLPTICIN